MADFAIKASTNGVIVVLRLWNEGYDDGRNAQALDLLKELILGDWKDNTRGIRIRDKLFLEYDKRFEWPDKKADIKGNRFFCYGLKDQFGILVDGTVVPCCLDNNGDIPLGNILKDIMSRWV